jgi:hypothetical protein
VKHQDSLYKLKIVGPKEHKSDAKAWNIVVGSESHVAVDMKSVCLLKYRDLLSCENKPIF